MISNIVHRWSRFVITLCTAAGVIVGVLFGSSATAAPPYKVSYNGTPVTTAIPGKPSTLKFQVKNTGGTDYSGVRVIFHIPEGLTHSKVAPADARIEDNIISWVNVPIGAGKSFYPSLTFTMDSGTPLNTKLSLWVEVTGSDFEATSTNFSVTARKETKKVTSTLSSTDISTLFQSVYGRSPATSELQYWLGRRTDKPERTSLLGAMAYHKERNISH